MIPSAMMRGLEAYVEQGLVPDQGSCLWAILENDLAKAVCRADDETYLALREIVQLLWTYAPGSCWGNKAQITAWAARPQIEREGLLRVGEWNERPVKYAGVI